MPHGASFDDLWRVLPLHKVMVIGLPTRGDPGTYDVTVGIRDRFQHSPGWAARALLLRLPAAEASDLSLLQARIAERLVGFTWDSFRETDEDWAY